MRASSARPVHEQRLDVTDRAAVLAYADAVVAEFGVVNIVVNNAGIAFTGDIEQMSFEQIERVMDVDFWGVVNGTKAFLPHLIASGDGHVVNISSLFGLLAMPGQSAYNAAKFAVRGFTESLRQEMLIAEHPVEVTCVHPGGIKTAIARNAGTIAGIRPGRIRRVLRQQACEDHRRVGREDDRAWHRRQPPARPRRARRETARRAHPPDRRPLPAAVQCPGNRVRPRSEQTDDPATEDAAASQAREGKRISA